MLKCGCDGLAGLLAQIVVTQAARTAHAQDTHTPPDVKNHGRQHTPAPSHGAFPHPTHRPHLCLARSASRRKNGPPLTIAPACWACAGARLRWPCRTPRPDCCSPSCPQDTYTTRCQNGRQHTRGDSATVEGNHWLGMTCHQDGNEPETLDSPSSLSLIHI